MVLLFVLATHYSDEYAAFWWQWFPPLVLGLATRNGISYQRTGLDHSSFIGMSKFSVEKFPRDVLSNASETRPQCVSHGVMKLDRKVLFAKFREGLLLPRLVRARRGGRRGLADWLLYLKNCVLISLGSQRLIRHERSPYSDE